MIAKIVMTLKPIITKKIKAEDLGNNRTLIADPIADPRVADTKALIKLERVTKTVE